MTVSTHSRPKAAGNFFGEHGRGAYVSTHSRPKAAGRVIFGRIALVRFQHTAARRRLDGSSRRLSPLRVCFNTQPPEGGWGVQKNGSTPPQVSTHSRPKAAGTISTFRFASIGFQHTAARRRLVGMISLRVGASVFQHTAARRRLAAFRMVDYPYLFVSTHSRPKAAGRGRRSHHRLKLVSTHSRPKAAGRISNICHLIYSGFNTQPPEGGWSKPALIASSKS